jgi:hypothetical protein
MQTYFSSIHINSFLLINRRITVYGLSRKCENIVKKPSVGVGRLNIVGETGRFEGALGIKGIVSRENLF